MIPLVITKMKCLLVWNVTVLNAEPILPLYFKDRKQNILSGLGTINSHTTVISSSMISVMMSSSS